MEENIYKIRKDKVKNIAIIFLSVMLVLTFFSNSILNHALPEVATECVTYDTITERVRGTGMVEADDPYKVVAKDSRTIQSVAVSAGDMVTKDQVLFYLEDEESEELKTKEDEIKAKEEELSAQVLDYMTAILSVDISNQAYQNIQTDNIATVAAYQGQIEASRQKVQAAQDTVDSLNRQILVAGMDSEDDVDRATELAVAQANRDSAAKRMNDAEAAIADANAKIAEAEATIADLDKKAGEAGVSLEIAALNAANEYNAAKSSYDTSKTTLAEALKTALEAAGDGAPEYKEGDYFDKDGLPKSVDALAKLMTLSNENGCGGEYSVFQSAYDTFLSKRAAKEEADKNLAAYQKAQNTLASAKSALTTAQNALKNAKSEYESYQKKVDKLTNETAESAGDNEEYRNGLKLSLADAESALKAAQEEQEQLLKDISSELALSSKNGEIADTEKELAELKEEYAEIEAESMGATVVSPVEGTIISVSKTAGEATSPQEEVALIQVAGKGMTVSFSVTNEQASKVKVGDIAELQNAWYYDDVMVTLSKIKPDTEEPGKKKMLEFTVEGSVQSGEQLALTVGERSAEYDLVVPNSAVREDKNGKFVFIIEEKATPFGNRYKAKRVDVEVMASDETKSALTADLEGYEYVITTSNQPVEAGDQVRLADY